MGQSDTHMQASINLILFRDPNKIEAIYPISMTRPIAPYSSPPKKTTPITTSTKIPDSV